MDRTVKIETTEFDLEFKLIVRKLENVAKIIHPYSTVTIELEQFDAAFEVSMNKVTTMYEMGYPSDIVPYDQRSQALDSCISKMRKSEQAEVSISSKLDPKKQFYCKLLVIEINHSVPLKAVDDDQRLDYSEDLRNRGNHFYKERNYESAMIAYKGSLFWASISCDSDRDKRRQSQGQIFANLSAIHFQQKRYELTVICSSRVIDLATSTKANVKNINSLLIRRADSYSKLNEFELARQDIAGICNATDAQQKRVQSIESKIETETKGH